MPKHLALLICAAFILWLLHSEQRTRQRTSPAIWIPFLWLVILGSRPVSSWFGMGSHAGGADADLEGSPFDRIVFLILILAGLSVLWRRAALGQIKFSDNRWLALFFLWLGISAFWSDYPFVAFKRWFKDVGNLIMVLVLFTERDPVNATKAIFVRAALILVPLSVVYIRYFPDVGRYYDRFSGQAFYGGVTTNKNLLGITLAVSAVFLVEHILEVRRMRRLPGIRSYYFALMGVGLMTIWLFDMAESSTALVCSLLGVGILIAGRMRGTQGIVGRIWIWSFASICLLLASHFIFNSGEMLAAALGRDLTFTGRTEIWQIVLREKTDPLLGSGFYSFWLGDRSERLSEGYSFRLNEAHNGYIETYLNSGIVGLVLLAGLLFSVGKRLSLEVTQSFGFGKLRLALFIVTLVYNFTESLFNRLTPIWFAFLMAVVALPQTVRPNQKISQMD